MAEYIGYVKDVVYAIIGIAVVGGSLIKIGIEQIKNTSSSVGGTEGVVMGIGGVILAAGFTLALLGAFMR